MSSPSQPSHSGDSVAASPCPENDPYCDGVMVTPPEDHEYGPYPCPARKRTAAAYRSGDVLPDGTTLIIGNIDPRSEAADRLLDGITMALQEFDTETLLGIADYRDTLDPEGWMQPLIRGYVEVWR